MVHTMRWQKSNYIKEEMIGQYFDFVIATAVRSKLYCSIVIIRSQELNKNGDVLDYLNEFMISQLRDSDLLTKLNNEEWCFVLTNSGEVEAKAFVNRVFTAWETNDPLNHKLQFSVFISIVNRQVSFEQVVEDVMGNLSLVSNRDSTNIVVSRTFFSVEKELVKVSVIEKHPLLLSTLTNRLLSMSADYNIQFKSFDDGFEFLQSNWYKSSEKQLIILNEIMPRMNGYNVLHALRNEPSTTRFRILMLTERANDEVLSAYEHGLDDHIKKPFKIELFEAKVKRLIER